MKWAILVNRSTNTDIALTAVGAYPNKYQKDGIFDTTASLHMTFDLGRFETFLANTRTIEVAGGTLLEYKGKGSCLVYPLYPYSTTSVIRLINVLYIPTLGYNLILWNVLQNHFLYLIGGNHVYIKDTRDASQPLILHGLFHRNLLFLIKSKPNAFLTSSKPILYTKSSASKLNAFTKSKPSTNLTVPSTSIMTTSFIVYSYWHKAFGHVDIFA